MQPVAAVRDVRNPEILACRQQVLDPPREQRSQGDLVWQGTDVDGIVAAGAGMQVNPITASFCDSAPVTYSVFVSGSRSPNSVASAKFPSS
jgi:hypothetical protein